MHTSIKNAVLTTLAELINENERGILQANEKDISENTNFDPSLTDRLKVDKIKIRSMIKAVEDSVAHEDPEGKIMYTYNHENNLKISNKLVPFGTILIIYESRPDVTVEAAIIAFKAGNKILLKGGKEARNTNLLLTALWHEALISNGVDSHYVKYLDISREDAQNFIKQNNPKFDLIIPRGGEALINFVKQNSSVPMIISGRGNNFLYIDISADFDMATDLILNGKSRISVCNALDKVLINRNIDNVISKTSELIKKLNAHHIETITLGDFSHIDGIKNETCNHGLLQEEFLASKILLSWTDEMEDAIKLINEYSGGHSATIVTENIEQADRFQEKVDCAAVYHNASTRFTDGGQFGFGAEIAISTQKLHFRGPIGIDQLVTNKWYISGNGQTR